MCKTDKVHGNLRQITGQPGARYLRLRVGATSGSYMVLEDNSRHQIRYRPNDNTFTTGSNLPSLSVRAWDKTEEGGRTTGQTIVLTALTGDALSEEGGSVSRESGALRLTINSVNDRPTLAGISDITPAVDEDVAMYGPFTMRGAFDGVWGPTYTEIDAADSENLLIYNVRNRQGRWQFRAGGSWSDIPADAQGATSPSYMVLEDRRESSNSLCSQRQCKHSYKSYSVSIGSRMGCDRRRGDNGRDDSGQCVNSGGCGKCVDGGWGAQAYDQSFERSARSCGWQ